MSGAPDPDAHLAPCPFCGNQRSGLGVRTVGDDWLSWVACGGCGAEGPTAPNDTDARARWNAARALADLLGTAAADAVERFGRAIELRPLVRQTLDDYETAKDDARDLGLSLAERVAAAQRRNDLSPLRAAVLRGAEPTTAEFARHGVAVARAASAPAATVHPRSGPPDATARKSTPASSAGAPHPPEPMTEEKVSKQATFGGLRDIGVQGPNLDAETRNPDKKAASGLQNKTPCQSGAIWTNARLALAVVLSALRRLASPERFTLEAAVTGSGVPVDPLDPRAARWSVSGALERAAGSRGTMLAHALAVTSGAIQSRLPWLSGIDQWERASRHHDHFEAVWSLGRDFLEAAAFVLAKREGVALVKCRGCGALTDGPRPGCLVCGYCDHSLGPYGRCVACGANYTETSREFLSPLPAPAGEHDRRTRVHRLAWYELEALVTVVDPDVLAGLADDVRARVRLELGAEAERGRL